MFNYKARTKAFWHKIDASIEVLRNYSEMDVNSLDLNKEGVHEASVVKNCARITLSFLEGNEQGDVRLSGGLMARRTLETCHNFRDNLWKYEIRERT